MNCDKATGKVTPARESGISMVPETRLDIRQILDGLEDYHSPRRPWHWREERDQPREVGDFTYYEVSKPLEQSVPLPGSRGFGYIDPQPDCV
ncbi:MAG: hypothetical protein GX849_05830, partial [Clostridiaceae bacterium]|nr:hypothetical protein [Clostridiaceae bacterium]